MHRTFQSTLPREERLRAGSKSFSVAANFNPRSHERSDSASISCSPYSTYFNPRSHERSDRNWALTDSESIISIHAPTRGATLLCEISNPLLAFQSTLPREERRSKASLIAFFSYFNPRSHERSDLSLFCRCATLDNFNPRSHERSDQSNI